MLTTAGRQTFLQLTSLLSSSFLPGPDRDEVDRAALLGGQLVPH